MMLGQSRHALFLLLLLFLGSQVLEVEASFLPCGICLAGCGSAIIAGSIGVAATGGAAIPAASPLGVLIAEHCSMCVGVCLTPTPF